MQLFNCLKRSSDIEGIFDFPIHEESAEHFFIYNMENYWPHHYLHGDGLVLGILLMAEIADPELAEYSFKLMKIAGMKGIMPPKDTVKTILEDMPQFVIKNNFNYSMVDTQAYQDADFDVIIDKVFQQIEELNSL